MREGNLKPATYTKKFFNYSAIIDKLIDAINRMLFIKIL